MKPRPVRVAGLFLSLLSCMGSVGWAQDWAGQGSDRPKVEMASVSPVRVTPGGKSTVNLNFRVRPNYHINSNKPGSEMLIPTVLKLDPPTDVVVSTSYPEGKDLAFAFSPGHKLNVYTGDFQLTTRVIAERKLRPGKYRVHGELRYQACDARACYPPSDIPVAFDITVARPSSAHARRNPAQSPNAR